MLSPLMTSISRSTTPVYPFNKNPSDRLTLTYWAFAFQRKAHRSETIKGFRLNGCSFLLRAPKVCMKIPMKRLKI